MTRKKKKIDKNLSAGLVGVGKYMAAKHQAMSAVPGIPKLSKSARQMLIRAAKGD